MKTWTAKQQEFPLPQILRHGNLLEALSNGFIALLDHNQSLFQKKLEVPQLTNTLDAPLDLLQNKRCAT